MTGRQRIRGFVFGPFISATVEDDVRRTSAERTVAWVIVCLLIAFAAPPIGVPMLLLTAAYLAAVRTARSTTNTEVQP